LHGELRIEDKKIKCIDYHNDFIFTEGEQQFLKIRETVNQLGARTVAVKERLKKEPVALEVIDYDSWFLS
jgi:hypothetical protein